MHDFYYTKLLNDPAKFHPRSGNKTVEAFELLDGSVSWVESDIDEASIPDWLQGPRQDATSPDSKTSRLQPALRLLIGAPEEHHSDGKILPLPLSLSTFETIRALWNLPTELLRMMLSSLPLAVPLSPINHKGQALTGIMVRGARSRDWNFCVAVLCNAAEGQTVAIVNGMQESEIQLLLTCLKQSKNHIRDPMLLPVFLLELKVNCFALLLEKRALGIEEIEHSTGMRHGFSENPQRLKMFEDESREKLKTLDFHPITQKLTGLTGTLSFCHITFQSSLKALDLVVSVRATLQTQAATPHNHSPDPATQALDQRIQYLFALIDGARSLGDVLATRTRAQVQTMYSLIGQRDNKVNIATAAASREISALSLLHNQAMKTIAEESRNVAILTRKDSIDMRIIAAVTLVFLPGTFIATVFGSNLFQFLPASSSQVVSKWIWLYAVLTTAITAIVLLFWWLFSRREMHDLRIQNLLREVSTTDTGPSSLEKQTNDILNLEMPFNGPGHTRSRSVATVQDDIFAFPPPPAS
ncbi:hypothetical protein DV737_g1584, partial [Chaetothyriales sp. CBS 132003]